MTNGVQSLYIFDAVELVRPRWLAAVHLTDSLKAIPLQVRPIGEIADDPRERVADIDASSNC